MTTGTDLLVIPKTGEQIDLATLATDELATLALNLREWERDDAKARKHVERALIDAMQRREHRVEHTPSGYTIEVNAGHTRVWDPDELEGAARHLVDEGVIQAGQYTGLLRRETKVDGRIAQRLLGALTGTARRTIEACFTWKTGEPTVKITPPSPPAIEATAEVDE
jgi:hypothetical protein